MTMNEYQLITRETSGDDSFAVLALGLIGESVEACEAYDMILDTSSRTSMLTKRTNFLKEMGDVLWYAARIYDCLNQEFEKSHENVIFHQKLPKHDISLLIKAAAVSEHIKKHLGHGHEINNDFLIKSINSLITVGAEMLQSCGYTISEAMSTNVEKLRKRYPNGFEVEKSKNRQNET